MTNLNNLDRSMQYAGGEGCSGASWNRKQSLKSDQAGVKLGSSWGQAEVKLGSSGTALPGLG